MLPQARIEGLTIREMPEETLIFDRQTHKAHCLNAIAALVWKHCDGRTSVAELAHLLKTKVAVSESEAVVQLALEQLSRRGLLEAPVAPLSEHERYSRRDALKKIAVAMVSLPVIMTITAKRARAQASQATITRTTAPVGGCQTAADCQPTNFECTVNRCDQGRCVQVPGPNGVPCFSIPGPGMSICFNGTCIRI